MINRFTAFDFETASGKNPCSIGIAVFEDGKIIETYYSLINPEIEKFNPIAQKKHKIKKEEVINERNFGQIWGEIKRFFNNSIIVAHNSSTDLSVLIFSLEKYDLSIPSYECYCTMRISKKVISLKNYKLETVLKHYDIVQNNSHNALEDAEVCGKLFHTLIANVIDYSLFKKENEYKFGGISKRKRSRKKLETKSVIDEYFDKKALFSEIQTQSSILLDKKFVVSGVFHKVSRTELKKLIEDNGGKVSSSISGKTNYVVAGDNMGPSKKTKAENLGVPIISEDDFLQMIS